MHVRTTVNAGGRYMNHNQTLVHDRALPKVATMKTIGGRHRQRIDPRRPRRRRHPSGGGGRETIMR